ncbi:MAG: sigma-54 dependent transcriptional regulator [Acetobacteraceae bacterium]|nr:sigma-54 dependent transcriptional regulator [Acetobacteraceae bacterium]
MTPGGSGRPEVLVVDDEQEVCTFFRHLLGKKGYSVTLARGGQEALEAVDRTRFDLALVDLKLPDSDGITLLKHIKAVHPTCEVIIMTGYSTVKTAVEAIQLGAYDYIEKPFEVLEDVERLIERSLDLDSRLQDRAKVDAQFGFVVGNNFRMRRVISAAERIARKDITVLIQGETGTGKEVVARFIHSLSHRADHPFIGVNCAAFTETLLESELFGHEKGSFTGATGLRRGIFEIADRGTLFLDEVGAASLAIQARLLRVLETGEFMRVGGEKVLKTNVRVIAATNSDLLEEVRAGRFREDLLYRLDVASLHLPPLRERREDIPLFVSYFLARQAGVQGAPLRIAPEAMELLRAYHWPGNIRELANVVTQAAALADGPVIQPRHLPRKILEGGPAPVEGSGLRPKHSAAGWPSGRPAAGGESGARPAGASAPGWAAALEAVSAWADAVGESAGEVLARGGRVELEAWLDAFRQAEARLARGVIARALQATMGDRARAAELLGLTPRSLRYLYREKGRAADAGAGQGGGSGRGGGSRRGRGGGEGFGAG